jgi:hypothetical protein
VCATRKIEQKKEFLNFFIELNALSGWLGPETVYCLRWFGSNVGLEIRKKNRNFCA